MHRRTTIALAVGAPVCVALPALASPPTPNANVRAHVERHKAVSASAKLNGNGRFAAERKFGMARAEERHELRHWRKASREHGVERREHERQMALRHRHRHFEMDRDDFAQRDRDDFARRGHSGDRDHRIAAERRDGGAFPSRAAQRNSNGRFAADREFGVARAEERHELHAAVREQPRADRFKRDDDRFRAADASNAERAARDSRTSPHFVNAMGAPRDRTADRDDLAARERVALRASPDDETSGR